MTIHSIPNLIRNGFGGLKLRILLALCFVFVATPQLCAQSDKGEVSFTTILLSTSSGIGFSVDRVIYSQADFEAFWSLAHASSSPMPPTPEIDFGKRMVVVAAMGPQISPKHSIKITRIERVKTMVRVSIEETQPGKNCSAVGLITNPVHMVETDQLFAVTFRRSIGSRCADFD
jgi:hypothetical protein